MTTVPNNEMTPLNEGTTLMHPSLHGWDQIKLDNEESVVRAQIRGIFRYNHRPWVTVDFISNSPSVEIMVMNVLQQELDDTSCPDGYRTTCMKCLLALSKARNIVPSSFSSRNVVKEGTNPICGGGFADIWKGRLHDTQVCLKVLRVFIPEKAQEKLLREFCREALVWRQLRHPNILPFLGVSEDLFAPSYCLISPWMVNGNIMSYLEAHPDHDRLTSLIQAAEGMKYLHNHDPPIIHADIRGANILVMDDLSCCLADFGLSLFAESQALNSSSRMDHGCIRWLAPEYMDSKLFNQSYLAARDVYAYGCTVVEVFTGEPPFSNIKNDAGVIHEVLIKQSHPPRPPSNIFPDDGLWELVIACLSTTSSQRPNVEKILAQLQSTSRPALTLSRYTNASLNTENFSSPSNPPVLVDQNLDERSVPLLASLDQPPKRKMRPFIILRSFGKEDFDSYSDSDSDSVGIRIPSPPPSTPTRKNHSANQTAPSSGKRRPSSSPKEPPASPSTRSTNPNLLTKSENIHLDPSQASEGIDVPHAKRIKLGEPLAGHVLLSEQDATSHECVTSSLPSGDIGRESYQH